MVKILLYRTVKNSPLIKWYSCTMCSLLVHLNFLLVILKFDLNFPTFYISKLILTGVYLIGFSWKIIFLLSDLVLGDKVLFLIGHYFSI